MPERIEGYDLISPEAIENFIRLTDEIKTAQAELELLLKSSKAIREALGGASNFKEINEEIDKLTKNVNQLTTAEKRITDAQKKYNDYTKKGTNDLSQFVKNTKSFNSVISLGKQKLRAQNEELRKHAAELEKARRAQEKERKEAERANKVRKNSANTRKSSILGVKTLSKSLYGLVGAYASVTTAARLFRRIFDTTKELDSLSFAMKNVITDSTELAETQAFLDRITEAYGLELFDATRSYIKFRAAIKATNLTVNEGRKIFESFAKTGSILGLRADEMNGVFLALEQMISKGKITTEELRRQLGERIPGAFNIMANAIGVSVSKLDDMLKKGEVLSEDALPKMAREMEKTFGIEQVTKVDTLVAAQERLRTTWRNFIQDLSASDDFRIRLEALDTALRNLGKRWGFFQQSQESGSASAKETISNIRANSKNAAEEFENLSAAAAELGSSIADIEGQINDRMLDIRETLGHGTFSDEEIRERFTSSEKIMYQSYQHMLGQQKEFTQALNDNWKRAYVERLDFSEKSTKELEDILAAQTSEDRELFSEKASLYYGAVIQEVERRKKAEEEATKETAKEFSERFSIFKAHQESEFQEYKEHLNRMRAIQEQKTRENLSNEIEADRAIAGQKIDMEIELSNFKQKQLLERLKYVDGNAKEEAAIEEELAKEKADIQKKITDFQISEGKKEHNLFMKYSDDEAKKAKMVSDEKILAIEREMQAQILALEEAASAQLKLTPQQGYGEIINMDLVKQSLGITISGLEEILNVADLTAEEQLAIERRLFNAKKSLQQAERDEYVKTYEDRLRLNQEILSLTSTAISDVFKIFSDFQSARLDAVEWQYEREMALAGENVDQQIAVENRYNREKRKLARNQAITERAQTVFSILLNTYEGVTSALAGAPLTLPLIPFIKAIGLANLAAALAVPLPKYEKGGKHKGGFAEFSEGNKSELCLADTQVYLRLLLLYPKSYH